MSVRPLDSARHVRSCQLECAIVRWRSLRIPQRRKRPSRPAVLAALALACMGCSAADDRSAAAWAGTVDSTGDSVVILTTNPYDGEWPPIMVADSVRIAFDIDELMRPSRVLFSATGELVVADGRHLLIVDTLRNAARTVGRPGKGPGEYAMIHGVAIWPGDSLVVFDGYQLRLTWHAWDGTVLRTQPLEPTRWQRASGKRTDLRVFGQLAILAWGPSLVRTDGTPDTVVLEAYDFASDTGVVAAEIEDVSWVHSASVNGPRYPFGPRALYSVGSEGTVAFTDGVAYCITLRSLGEAPVRRACRSWTRQPVGSANKPPPGVSDDELGRVGPMLRDLLAVQEFGERMHSIAELRFDDQERLWVRVVDSTYVHHPFYLGELPRLRPEHYTWEVFDRSGRLTAKVALPSRFTPSDFHEGTAFGTLERDDGTVVVASVHVPDG